MYRNTTLITESKMILHNNGIIIQNQKSNPPMFKYVTFCKSLSTSYMNCEIKQFLENKQPNLAHGMSLSFITNKLTNLQELEFLLSHSTIDFKILQYDTFPQL